MNLPETAAGAACLRAAETCIAIGEVAAVDMGSALALAEAMGVPRAEAAPLLADCAAGIMAGQADRRAKA